jgi:hypothetical protein
MKISLVICVYIYIFRLKFPDFMRRMKSVGHVIHMDEMKYVCKIFTT